MTLLCNRFAVDPRFAANCRYPLPIDFHPLKRIEVRVLVVDDHPVIQEVLRAVLARAFQPVSVTSQSELRPALRRPSVEFDLAILDLGLPGYSDIEALLEFRRALPDVPVIIFSSLEDVRIMRAASRAGASAYVPKTCGTEAMIAAVAAVASGKTWFVPAMRDAEPRTNASSADGGLSGRLTDRQLAVLQKIALGLSNREIAHELAIAENTVKHHAKAVFHVLGVSSRAAAMVAAARRGMALG